MLRAAANSIQKLATRRIARPAAWKIALLAGFVTQLLLLVFVTAIGLRQLEITTNNLNLVVDVHMRKQALTKTMAVSARERIIFILMLSKIQDLAERNKLLAQFSKNGAEFGIARRELRDLPLNIKEQELLALQGRLTGDAQPMQLHVVDLIDADFTEEAELLILTQAIPAQNLVISALSQLDAEAQKVALKASTKARKDHQVARRWMVLLSGAALLIGFIVAAFVFVYANRVGRERERLATEDTLTGLPNRMLFMDRLKQSLIRAERHKTLVGVMFIDLDRFKRVNDTLGHASGDQLICEVAQRLCAIARAEDIVARLGGDEFVVVVSRSGTSCRSSKKCWPAWPRPTISPSASCSAVAASASVSIPMTATIPAACCRTPTPRCIMPKTADATVSSYTTPR